MATRAEHAARPGRSSKWIARRVRLAIYIRCGFRCLYCNRDLCEVNPWEASLDHLIPHSAGGSDDPSNLVMACAQCNYSRQDRPWRAFAGNAQVITRISRSVRRVLNVELARAIIDGDVNPLETRDV
jgi:5-methylcytosine-specific restriction endonuclease McrA